VRVAVISDIHGNLAALEAVLESIGTRCDEVWCLGDLVGYGARPNESASVCREHCSVVLAGNHDLAACGRIDTTSFSRDAGRAIRWTREVLAPEIERYLADLAPLRQDATLGLYHGSPRDPVWEYVLNPSAARTSLERAERPVVLVGHTHAQTAVRLVDGRVSGGRAGAGALVELRGAGATLLNPGSVGQPRDGDPRAGWLLLDLDDAGRPLRATFERTRYDVVRAQREITAAGLPVHLAERLALGA
jgi:predicted phosphodiesterase